ncbi:GntR family transcriptional regulator [Dictyobacter kobayashii]|uniref:GntR family transcriptional regulator n=1 Tax=Dictyobacter kobayashii TaxID=2014872 RepID=A0A402AT13_9CHLR|nr:GntR family transcriptional regulator [Dictyobacter kobayashii]GCE22183.1 GntR family transcriptional regulator [Dictyobacter kobayashii]
MYDPLGPLSVPKAPGYREAAFHAIKEAILSGQLKYDQPLVEEDIAIRLQVSRTPVREALAILHHEGLIAPRSGRGFYVCRLTREEFVDLFTANEVIEPYLVRRAALRATDAQMRDMEDAITLGKQSEQQQDIAGMLRSGRDFHRAVGSAAANTPLTRFVVSNEERTDLYLLSCAQVLDVSQLSQSNQEHERIFTAIVQRDPETAARLVVYHSQSVRERLAPFFTVDEAQMLAEKGSDLSQK